MFDWLGDIISGIGSAIGDTIDFIGSGVGDAIWNAMLIGTPCSNGCMRLSTTPLPISSK